MKINFTSKEKEYIRSIIEQYREISNIIYDYQNQIIDIQERIKTATKNLDLIKKKEDELMTELHKKYGEFSLQDVYNIINL